MAGREFSGAESARADLFEGRPWMIDSTDVDQQAVAWGKALIESLSERRGQTLERVRPAQPLTKAFPFTCALLWKIKKRTRQLS